MTESSNITVILNGFRRPDNLSQQMRALKQQTVQPEHIFLWYNEPGRWRRRNNSVIRQTTAAVSNHNFGVWSRFYYALNAPTKYVCVFDDDTIPGRRWLENCLKTIQTHRGLLGSIGVVFESDDDYYQHRRVGWANPNEVVQQVDIVGHSWFFEKEFLTAFCRELPLLESPLCGEDIHFSYTLQRYFGLNTYVPPHPAQDKEWWGSLKGNALGMDKHAISRKHLNEKDHTFFNGVNQYFRASLAKGWKLQRDVLPDALITKDFRRHFEHLCSLLQKKIPFAFNRFSDGELFILQNKELILGQNLVKVGDKEVHQDRYKPEDFKHFDPVKHTAVRKHLFDAFHFEKENYFKGLSCWCCVGRTDFHWQLEQLQNPESPYLTWANLLVNGNYKQFVETMFPFFSSYPIVFICHEKADLTDIPSLVKDFRVGYNAMVNDYEKIEDIAQWIEQKNIEGHLFLFAASAFSKMAIHQLYARYPNNTYIDIGTTLNKFIKMPMERSYLESYWLGKKGDDLDKVCQW